MSDVFEDLDRERAAGAQQGAEVFIRSALGLVQTAKAMPLSASVLVSREELAELLQGALDHMPDELRQARWLLKERDEFLAEKSREADALLEEVRVQAERMVQRTEIVRWTMRSAWTRTSSSRASASLDFSARNSSRSFRSQRAWRSSSGM